MMPRKSTQSDSGLARTRRRLTGPQTATMAPREVYLQDAAPVSKKLLIASVCSAIVIMGISCASFCAFRRPVLARCFRQCSHALHLSPQVTVDQRFVSVISFVLLDPNSTDCILPIRHLLPVFCAVSQVTTSFTLNGASQPIPAGERCPFGPFRIESTSASQVRITVNAKARQHSYPCNIICFQIIAHCSHRSDQPWCGYSIIDSFHRCKNK